MYKCDVICPSICILLSYRNLLTFATKMFLTCLSHSPSQRQDNFKNLCSNFDIVLSQINNERPAYSVITGDVNARCSRWCRNDIKNSTGQEIVMH